MARQYAIARDGADLKRTIQLIASMTHADDAKAQQGRDKTGG